MVALRALSLVVVSLGLVSTVPSSERDPDAPCPEDQPECESGPPGPMPVVHAKPGEEVLFHCYAYSPCALVVVEGGDGAKSYLATITSELAGGFGVTATNVSGVPRDQWYMMCAEFTWCLGGSGFNPGGPQKFAHQVPSGNASTWSFDFAPVSGQRGGDIILRVDLSDGEASVPGWAPDGKRIPDG